MTTAIAKQRAVIFDLFGVIALPQKPTFPLRFLSLVRSLLHEQSQLNGSEDQVYSASQSSQTSQPPQSPQLSKAANLTDISATGLHTADLNSLMAAYWQNRPEFDAATCSDTEYWKNVLGGYPLEVSPEVVARCNALDEDSWSRRDDVIINFLYQWHQDGINLHLLSNAPAYLMEILRRSDWLKNFQSVTFSAEVKMAKPQKEIFYHALNQAGLQAENTLFIDDTTENLAAAKTLGLQTYQYKWGDDFRALDQIIRNFVNGKPARI